MSNVMKRFVRYKIEDSDRFGWALLGEHDEIWAPSRLELRGQALESHSLTGTLEDYNDLADRLEGATTKDEVTIDLRNVLPPIDVNARIYVVEHNSQSQKAARGLGRGKYRKPTICPKTMKVTTHGDPVYLMDGEDSKLDAEVNLMVVIGRDAKNVTRKDAIHYVGGYAVLTDLADRGVQGFDGQGDVTGINWFESLGHWGGGKSGDGYGPVGPVLAFVADPYDLGLELHVRGRSQQKLETIDSDVFFGIDEIIAFLSNIGTIPAGSGIAMGSPSGAQVEKDMNDSNGNANYFGRWTVVEANIPGLGKSINTVVPDDYKAAPTR